MKPSDTAQASKTDPWSDEELEKWWARMPGPPYRKHDLTQLERDKLAHSIRAGRKANAILRQTGKWPDEVEYRGEIFRWLD
jgi:hypothetical protein